MTTRFPLNVVAQEGQKLPEFSGLCKRVRFTHSDCQRCLDFCPENAITFGPGPIINERCSDCGLCQTACPTEVFQSEVHTDQHHLNKISRSVGKDPVPGKKQRSFFHCQQAERQHRDSLPIPCLGSVTENFILGAALLGLDEIVLTKGDCSRCRLKRGEQLFINSVDAFRALSKSIALENFTLNLKEEQKEGEVTSSRRSFFARISGKQEDEIESAPDSKHRAMRTDPGSAQTPKNGTRASPKRQFLRTLLQKAAPNESASVAYEQSFPWGTIKIDENNCVTCGICVAVCPTGAISRRTEDQQLSHYLVASLCTNCRLCEEACPQNVISFAQEFPLSDALKDEANAITKISLNACLICGEVIPVREGQICTTCDKRQMSSRFVNM